jgi:phosphatidylglycerol---prolipoprotein diacylglyceryl transferase
MYPDFSYILHAIFGTEPDNAFSIIKTFGLMLAAAFLVSAVILSLELKRKTNEGIFKPITEIVVEGLKPSINFIITQLIIGFILGFKLVYVFMNFDEFRSDAAGVLLSTKGNFGAGILVAALYAAYQYYSKNKKALPKPIEKKVVIQPVQLVGDITMIAAISGLIGAKIFALFESTETIKAFFQDPLGQLLSGSGLAIYGGLIVAFFSVLYYIRKKGLGSLHMMDTAAPAIITGYAVGRIGCQLSGDGDWGIDNPNPKPDWLSWLPDNLWVQTYPHNVINAGDPIPGCTWEYCMQLNPGVYPTPIYETVMGFMILGILWSLRKRIKIPGMIFFIYMVLNGVERFFIEKIRVNDKIHLFGGAYSQAEIISVLFIIAGIAGGIWAYMYHNKQRA